MLNAPDNQNLDQMNDWEVIEDDDSQSFPNLLPEDEINGFFGVTHSEIAESQTQWFSGAALPLSEDVEVLPDPTFNQLLGDYSSQFQLEPIIADAAPMNAATDHEQTDAHALSDSDKQTTMRYKAYYESLNTNEINRFEQYKELSEVFRIFYVNIDGEYKQFKGADATYLKDFDNETFYPNLLRLYRKYDASKWQFDEISSEDIRETEILLDYYNSKNILSREIKKGEQALSFFYCPYLHRARQQFSLTRFPVPLLNDPEGLAPIKNIKAVYLQRNPIKSLPKELCNLTSLEKLVLNLTSIESLPSEIWEMPTLRKVSYFQNTAFDPAKVPASVLSRTRHERRNILLCAPELQTVKANRTTDGHSDDGHMTPQPSHHDSQSVELESLPVSDELEMSEAMPANQDLVPPYAMEQSSQSQALESDGTYRLFPDPAPIELDSFLSSRAHASPALSKAVDDLTAHSPLQVKVQKPRRAIQGGIQPKYFGIETLPDLPESKQMHKKKVDYNASISLRPLAPTTSQPYILPNTIEVGESVFEFYSLNGIPSPKEQCTFVLAGRNYNGYVPNSGRNILVLTPAQYHEMKVAHDKMDVLVISSLKSKSHGEYEHLQHITCRRIAAFMIAHAWELETCMVIDDNIEEIKINSDNPSPDWSTLWDLMTPALSQSVCVSLSCADRKWRQGDEEKLGVGSKVFLFDMSSIRQIMPHAEDMVNCLQPAQCSNWWGTDYYFQTFLENLFIDKSGYYCLDNTLASYIRSKEDSNSWARVCQEQKTTAEIYLNRNFLENIKLNKLDSVYVEALKATQAALYNLVHENKSTHENRLKQYKAQGFLSRVHARANGLSFSRQHLICADAEQDTHPSRAQLKEAVQALENSSGIGQILYDYQKDALRSLADAPEQGPCKIIMTQGSGKTRTQFGLCHLIYAQGIRAPMIIVTPKKELVEQSYQEFINAISLLEEAKVSTLPKQNIIKISSGTQNISRQFLSINQTWHQEGLVLIFCRHSYDLFIQQHKDTLENISLAGLILDEYHNYPKDNLLSILEFHKQQSHLKLGITATPPKEDPIKHKLYAYTRIEALAKGSIAPLWTDCFNLAFSRNDSEKLQSKLGSFLSEHISPNGNRLKDEKGIIFIPGQTKHVDKLAKIIEKSGIQVFRIHSKNPQCDNDLETFRNLPSNTSAVVLALGKLRLGYDDPNLMWVINLRNGNDPNDVAQMALRAGRKRKVSDGSSALNCMKICYFMTFKDTSLERLERPNDPVAQLFIHGAYWQNKAFLAQTVLHKQVGVSLVHPTRFEPETSMAKDAQAERQQTRLFLQNVRDEFLLPLRHFDHETPEQIRQRLSPPLLWRAREVSSSSNKVTMEIYPVNGQPSSDASASAFRSDEAAPSSSRSLF